MMAIAAFSSRLGRCFGNLDLRRRFTGQLTTLQDHFQYLTLCCPTSYGRVATGSWCLGSQEPGLIFVPLTGVLMRFESFTGAPWTTPGQASRKRPFSRSWL